MSRFLFLLFPIMLFACSQKSEHSTEAGSLETLFKLPAKMKEVSGIALSQDKKMIWAIEDHGNKSNVYGISLETGKHIATVKINAENNDWEDITTDRRGNFYIGDFGNNNNDRKDLCILKIQLDSGLTQTPVLQKTEFYYEGQMDFPPKKSEWLYDCEGFVEMNGAFYLFTKNRSKNFDGIFLVYRVPDQSGNFEAKLIGKLKLPGSYNNAAVTSAALSPDGRTIALLTHKNIYLLTGFSENDFSTTHIRKVPLQTNTQKEALVFENSGTLLVADEKDKSNGGNLYRFRF